MSISGYKLQQVGTLAQWQCGGNVTWLFIPYVGTGDQFGKNLLVPQSSGSFRLVPGEGGAHRPQVLL